MPRTSEKDPEKATTGQFPEIIRCGGEVSDATNVWLADLKTPTNEMTATGKLSHLEGHEDSVLAALARLRKGTLSGRQGGKAPRWLATLLFDDLETAIRATKLPAPRSRTELTQTWYDKLAGPSPTSDDSNKLWDLAYKNVDDAIRTVAERIAKASETTVAAKSSPSSGFAEGVAEFLVGKIAWELRISGPLHDPSTDANRANIRLLPSIVEQGKTVQPLRMSRLRRVALSMGMRRISPFARKVIAFILLLLCAACTYAYIIAVRRTPTATASKVDVVTSGDVHLQYRGFQHDGTSPVCGCKEELDPNVWWGISSLAREVSMFRSGGPPYTKYVLTGAEPKQIQWLPGLFKTRAQIFILRQPFGGEGFSPRLLSSGKMPGGYEVVTMDEVDEAFIYIITKAPLHVNLLSKVPVFAMLPMANSEITAHRTVGLYASAASRVTITENYKPWIIPPSGELDEDGPYEFPIVDFVGPDVVFWTESAADIVTEHKAYHPPPDGGTYLMGVFVTKPPFTSRVGVMPLTDAERDEDVTTLGTKTKTPILTKGGTFQIEIPNPIDQMHDYSQIYSYARAHPTLPVDHIPLTYHAFAGPADKPPLILPGDFGFKNQFNYPPLPPLAGFNVFGPLSSVKVDAAQGLVAEESGESAIRLNVASTVELHDISLINPDRGILTLPTDSKDTIRLNLRATGNIFVDGTERLFSLWTRWLGGPRLAYLISAAGLLSLVISLALHRFGRRRPS